MGLEPSARTRARQKKDLAARRVLRDAEARDEASRGSSPPKPQRSDSATDSLGALREYAQSHGPTSDPTLRRLAGTIVRLQADLDRLKRALRSALKRRRPRKKG